MSAPFTSRRFASAIPSATVLAMAALIGLPSCQHAPRPPASQPNATAAPTAPWWQFILERRALLQAHAQTDCTPPWLAPVGIDSAATIDVGGVPRRYLLHLPAGYDGKTPLPLIIALHGGGLDGATMEYYSGLSDLADREGFIVAYPDGGVGPAASPIKKPSWDAHLNSPSDDVAFLRALIQKLEASLAVDRQHVMVTGGSAGGLMAHRFALEAGNQITAIAVFCGSFAWNKRNGEPPPMPEPVAPLSVLAVHGKLDKNVPYDGFDTDRARVWPVQRSVAFWANFDKCEQAADEEPAPALRRQAWINGRNNTEVCLYTIADAGHALPMRPTDKGPIKGSAVLWDFLVRDRMLKLQPQLRVFTGDRIYITSTCGPIPAGAEFRYTVDGSAPTPTSPLFAGPPSLTSTATFRAQCFVQAKPLGSEIPARYHRLALRPASQLVFNPVPGLRWAYYPSGWDHLPDFSTLKPAATGTCATPDLTLVPHREENYVLTFNGCLHAPTDGIYVLSITSDDGSAVYLGNDRIIDNDGLHEPLERSRAVALAAGYHPISIRYLQRAKDAVLSLTLQPPGMPARPLSPADVVYEK